MSISDVSGVNNTASPLAQSDQTSPARQLRQDFDALAKALSSGDLAGAQDAFSTFQQTLQTVQPPQSTQTGSSEAKSALNAVGQALSSGDLASAQNAFATLVQDLQGQATNGHHHHHHHAGQAAPASTTPVAATTEKSAAPSIDTTA